MKNEGSWKEAVKYCKAPGFTEKDIKNNNDAKTVITFPFL